MNERDVIDTMVEANNWRLVHTNTTDGYAVYRTFAHFDFGVLVVGHAREDKHINHVTWFSNDYPAGESIAAGDRFRYVLAALQGKR